MTVSPGAATTNEMTQNVGSMRNIGLEATIGARIIETQDFTWNTSYNIAWNKNEITKLNNSDDPNYYVTLGGMGATGNTCQAHKVGHPAYSFLLLEQVYDINGHPIEGAYVDQKVTMSWNNTLSYKNWDFGISLRASIGNYVYNNVRAKRTYKSNLYANSTLRNLVKSDDYFMTQQFYSDYYLENAGYVRCDNITLGYTWPKLLKENLRLRIYGAVQNPFVITKYKGIDPESAGGIDSGVYPRATTYTFGLVASF